jgi:hypothetical protein
MGYQPSGLITYWDLQADRSLRQLRTLADLSLIRITPSNRHILAAAGERLVAVDLLSGALAAEDPAPGLAGLALGPEGEELAAAPPEAPAVAFHRSVAGAAPRASGSASPRWPTGPGAVRGDRTAPSPLRGGSPIRRATVLRVYGLAFHGLTRRPLRRGFSLPDLSGSSLSGCRRSPAALAGVPGRPAPAGLAGAEATR